MPVLKISSEQKSIEKDLTLNVYTKYSLNSYTVSLRSWGKNMLKSALEYEKHI